MPWIFRLWAAAVGSVRWKRRMRAGIAVALAVWAALVMAVAFTSGSGGPPDNARVSGATPAAAPSWAVLKRNGTTWVESRGPFRDAEGCLVVSDRLNNTDPAHIYDCGPVNAPAARHPAPAKERRAF